MHQQQTEARQGFPLPYPFSPCASIPDRPLLCNVPRPAQASDGVRCGRRTMHSAAVRAQPAVGGEYKKKRDKNVPFYLIGMPYVIDQKVRIEKMIYHLCITKYSGTP